MANNMLLPVSRYTSPAFHATHLLRVVHIHQKLPLTRAVVLKSINCVQLLLLLFRVSFSFHSNTSPHKPPFQLPLIPPSLPTIPPPIFFKFPDAYLRKAKGTTHHDTRIRLNGTMVPQTAPMPSSILWSVRGWDGWDCGYFEKRR